MAQYDITTAGAVFEFAAYDVYKLSPVQIDSNHFILVFQGPDNDGFAQVFAVNTSTWAVTTASSTLEIDTTYLSDDKVLALDSNHFLVIWSGADFDGFAQVLAVNTSTWAVTTANGSLEYDTDKATAQSIVAIDTNHFLIFWGRDALSNAQVLTVNTGNWAVTTAGAVFGYQGNYASNVGVAKIDDNHFACFFRGPDNDGFAQVFAVNTSTWAVTTSGSALEFDTTEGYEHEAFAIDSTHFVNVWRNSGKRIAQVFAVNTSTWAITTAGSALEIDTSTGYGGYTIQYSSNVFILNWNPGNIIRAQAFVVNTSTWAISTKTALDVTASYGQNPGAAWIDSSYYINFWRGNTKGEAQVLAFEGTIPVVTRTATIQAKSRIKTASLAKTTQVKARLKTAGLAKTIQSKGRVKVLGSSKTSQAKARLKTINIAKTAQVKARLKKIDLAKTAQAKSRIKTASLAKTTQVKARLKQIGIASLVSVKSMIRSATTKTISAKAYLLTFGNIKRITAKSDIKNIDISKTTQAKSRIKTDGLAKTTQVKARLKTAGLAKTIQSKGRVKVLGSSKTSQAKARLKTINIAKTAQVKARLKKIDLAKTAQAKSRIKTASLAKTTQVKARLKTAGVDQTTQAKGSIKVADVSKDIRARANIKQLGSGKTIAVKAKIWAFRSGYVKMERGTYPKTLNDNRKI